MKETEDKSHNSNEVVITDIRMSFRSMIVFMVKWVIASIPAFIILFLIGVALAGLLLVLLGLGTETYMQFFY